MSESIYVTPRNKLISKLSLSNKRMQDVATDLNLSAAALSQVVKGRFRSKRIEDALNDIMGEKLFPVKPLI